MKAEIKAAILVLAKMVKDTVDPGEAMKITQSALNLAHVLSTTEDLKELPSSEFVDRFLSWPVPADVYPDGVPGKPGRTGTNLLTADQARQMLEYVLSVHEQPRPV